MSAIIIESNFSELNTILINKKFHFFASFKMYFHSLIINVEIVGSIICVDVWKNIHYIDVSNESSSKRRQWFDSHTTRAHTTHKEENNVKKRRRNNRIVICVWMLLDLKIWSSCMQSVVFEFPISWRYFIQSQLVHICVPPYSLAQIK